MPTSHGSTTSKIATILLFVSMALACVDLCDVPEVPYDGIDNDCDEGTDDDDLDGDGFALVNDCDDEDPEVHPGAVEVCNGLDDNCTGGPLTPPDIGAIDCITWWRSDFDGDGYANPATETCTCDPPPDALYTAGDCADGQDFSYPGAPELCDNMDNDCDGIADNGLPLFYYYDFDGDGWGNPLAESDGCNPPPGYVFNGDDCDDTDATLTDNC